MICFKIERCKIFMQVLSHSIWKPSSQYRWDIFIVFFKKIGKSLSASTTGSSAGSGGSSGNGGSNGGGGGGTVSGAGGGSLSGGGIVSIKQETTVELASLGHGSYTSMVDSTTFLSSQQQRVNNPPEDDEVHSMSHARCAAIFIVPLHEHVWRS